jgi:hypothetical protein
VAHAFEAIPVDRPLVGEGADAVGELDLAPWSIRRPIRSRFLSNSKRQRRMTWPA